MMRVWRCETVTLERVPVSRPEVGWLIGPFHIKLSPGKISDKKC